jgi:transposase
MNLDAIIARGPRATPASRNKVTSNEIGRLIIDAKNNDIDLNVIVLIFKLKSHHSANVIEMLELRGFSYKFLPPYSSCFMAIECMFAKWKTNVKRGSANTRALTRVELE